MDVVSDVKHGVSVLVQSLLFSFDLALRNREAVLVGTFLELIVIVIGTVVYTIHPIIGLLLSAYLSTVVILYTLNRVLSQRPTTKILTRSVGLSLLLFLALFLAPYMLQEDPLIQIPATFITILLFLVFSVAPVYAVTAGAVAMSSIRMTMAFLSNNAFKSTIFLLILFTLYSLLSFIGMLLPPLALVFPPFMLIFNSLAFYSFWKTARRKNN